MESGMREGASPAEEKKEAAQGHGGLTDIVTRLRQWARATKSISGPIGKVVTEAADEIERLRRIVAMWEDCAFKTKDLYGNVIVPRTGSYDGGVERIKSQEWSVPKVSTGHTGNQWFTIPEPPQKDTPPAP